MRLNESELKQLGKDEWELPKPLDCLCGHEIKSISIYYGRTPYSIFCKNCRSNSFPYSGSNTCNKDRFFHNSRFKC